MEYINERIEIIQLLEDLLDQNLLSYDGGGIARKVNTNRVLLTPTQAEVKERWKLKPEDLILTNLDGDKLEDNTRPSLASTHLMLHILKKYPSIKWVYHSHSQYLQFISCLELGEMPNIIYPAYGIGKVPVIDGGDEYKLKQKYLENPYHVTIPEVMSQRPEVFIVFDQLVKEFDKLFANRVALENKYAYLFLVAKHGSFCFSDSLDQLIYGYSNAESNARNYLLLQRLHV